MYKVIRGNKYGAKSQTYNGRHYHSKKEAAYAQQLDILKQAGEITEIIPQYKVELRVNGKLICNYYCDFYIEWSNGDKELHEVKGFETEVYRLKRKLLEAAWLPEHPEITYTVIT